MTLKITGSMNATIDAHNIQHFPNALGWTHRFACNNIIHVTGIQQGVAYNRHGNFHVLGAGQNVNGQEIRIRWTANGCDVFLR